jgi:hypothetical protein
VAGLGLAELIVVAVIGLLVLAVPVLVVVLVVRGQRRGEAESFENTPNDKQ